PCACLQALLAPFQIPLADTNTGIPVPVVFAVGAQTHVLHEAIEIFRTRTLRLIVADGLSNLFQRIETLGLLRHEGLYLVDALWLDARCDIHHDQGSGVNMAFTNGHQASAAAHGGAYQNRATLAQGFDNAFQVAHHHVLSIQSVARP